MANANKKKYKKRDHYQILTLKGSCNDIEKKAKKLGNDKLVSMYTMTLIKDNKSLDFLPNYVTLKDGNFGIIGHCFEDGLYDFLLDYLNSGGKITVIQ